MLGLCWDNGNYYNMYGVSVDLPIMKVKPLTCELQCKLLKGGEIRMK